MLLLQWDCPCQEAERLLASCACAVDNHDGKMDGQFACSPYSVELSFGCIRIYFSGFTLCLLDDVLSI